MSPKLKSFLTRWVINTVAVLVACAAVNGIHYDSPGALLTATLVLGILNAVLRPLLLLLALPLLLVTLGLFFFVINAGLLYLVGHMKGFHVDSFSAALWGAVVMWAITTVLNSLIGDPGDTARMQARVRMRGGGGAPPPPPRSDDGSGGGPVIDV